MTKDARKPKEMALRLRTRRFLSPEAILSTGLVTAPICWSPWRPFLLYHNSFQAIESERSAERSLELLATLESLFLVVRDAQTQAVDYLKRPNPEALERYKRATTQIGAAHEKRQEADR